MGDWWIIVASLATEPVCYILKPKEVAKRAVRDKNGAQAFWLPRKEYAIKAFEEKWERIGHGDKPRRGKQL